MIKLITHLPRVILMSIILHHAHLASAELLMLSAQLEQFTNVPSSPQIITTHAAPISTLDFSKHPCMTHAQNILVPLLTPFKFAHNGYTTTVIQPFVAWQEMTLGIFMRPILADPGQLIQEGYLINQQIPFIRTLTSHSSLDTIKEELKKAFESSPNHLIMLGGGDASCGYQAIKNLIIIYNNITSHYHSLMTLLDMYLINNLFGFENARKLLDLSGQGPWRHYMISALEKNEFPRIEMADPDVLKSALEHETLADKNGEWLSIYGLQLLVQKLSKIVLSEEAQKLLGKAFPEELPSNVAWCWFAPPTQNDLTTIEALMSKDAFLALCVCLDSKQAKHWFGVAISKNHKTTQIIIVDSKNKPRFDHELVKDIISTVTGMNVSQIKKYTQPAKNDLVIQKRYELTYSSLEQSQDISKMQLGVSVSEIAPFAMVRNALESNPLLTLKQLQPLYPTVNVTQYFADPFTPPPVLRSST